MMKAEAMMKLVLPLACFLGRLPSADGGYCFKSTCKAPGTQEVGCRDLMHETDVAEECCHQRGQGYSDALELLGKRCYRCHTCQDILGRVDGGWSAWGPWSPCSQSCGGGSQWRTRACNEPEPSRLGRQCDGKEHEPRACRTDPCPVDGGWTSWSAWSHCSKSCGEGSMQRERTCTNPRPQHEGKQCGKNSVQSSQCRIKLCPIDGKWSAWSAWTPCSKKCGQGVTRRVRACNSPAPQHQGLECEGSAEKVDFCNSQPCPVDGRWSKWSVWSQCLFHNCHDPEQGGVRIRSRACTHPSPDHGGRMCHGNMFEKNFCAQPDNCPVAGGWGPWSDWECTCISGFKKRECNNPEPQLGGAECEGRTHQVVVKDEDEKQFCAVCPWKCPCNEKDDNVEPVGAQTQQPEGSGDGGSGSGLGASDLEAGEV